MLEFLGEGFRGFLKPFGKSLFQLPGDVFEALVSGLDQPLNTLSKLFG